nr:hypothetical protein [uncultured Oscillibacter sp.]
MYNRYIRNDNGSYTRVPQEEPSSSGPAQPAPQANRSQSPPLPQTDKRTSTENFRPPVPPPPSGGSGGVVDGLTGFLRHILDQLHLDHVDTGDLLLLVLLFFLFREDADEELLVALGLLLIL